MLVIRYKNKPKTAFKPTLKLESTGYCPAGQWSGMFFRPGVFCGLKTIFEAPTVAEIVQHYFSELKRCNHEVFTCESR